MDSIVSAFITLVLVMDPLGNVPIFLAVLKDVEGRRRQWVIFRELLIALGVLLLFLYAGSAALAAMGLKQESISIGGAIILFLIALRMIFPSPYGLLGDVPDGEPFVVPLAIPAVAGPSSLAIAMLMVNTDPDRMMDWTLAVVGAWGVSAVILMASPLLLPCRCSSTGWRPSCICRARPEVLAFAGPFFEHRYRGQHLALDVFQERTAPG